MATPKFEDIEDHADLNQPFLKSYSHSCSMHLKSFCHNIGRRMVQSSMAVEVSVLCKRIGAVIIKDTSNTIHAVKMALALLLAFLLVLLPAPYALFGDHTIWAVITVIVVFEFSVGATLSKGLNRGVGTLLAVLFALGVGELAKYYMSGGVGHPIFIGVIVFVIGVVVTFWMIWPSLKSYEYGFRIFLLTSSLVMVAEYRGNEPLGTAINRFLIILLGGVIGIAVNVLLLPSWAGHTLHNAVSSNFFGVADSLEACVDEYLRGIIHDRFPSNVFMVKTINQPYDGCKSTLASASKEESLAGFASWEPPHGKFKMVKYPWNQYVRVGAVLRHCAYAVVALHGCLQSAIQAPPGVRKLFEHEINAVSIECSVVLRKLGHQMESMQKGDSMFILRQGVEHAIDELQQSLYFRSYLLLHRNERTHLEEQKERVSISVIPEVTRMTHAHTQRHDVLTQTYLSDDLESSLHVLQRGPDSSPTRCINKMYSWPSRLTDDLDFDMQPYMEQRVRLLESASALSVGTFCTLLMEVAHRLDYVVEAVHELSELAGFADAQDVTCTKI